MPISSNYGGSLSKALAARETLRDAWDVNYKALKDVYKHISTQYSEWLDERDPLTGSRMATLSLEGERSLGTPTLRLKMFDDEYMELKLQEAGRILFKAPSDSQHTQEFFKIDFAESNPTAFSKKRRTKTPEPCELTQVVRQMFSDAAERAKATANALSES